MALDRDIGRESGSNRDKDWGRNKDEYEDVDRDTRGKNGKVRSEV